MKRIVAHACFCLPFPDRSRRAPPIRRRIRPRAEVTDQIVKLIKANARHLRQGLQKAVRDGGRKSVAVLRFPQDGAASVGADNGATPARSSARASAPNSAICSCAPTPRPCSSTPTNRSFISRSKSSRATARRLLNLLSIAPTADHRSRSTIAFIMRR